MIFTDPLELVRFARTRCPYYRELYARLSEPLRWQDVPPVDVERYWATKARDFAATCTQPPEQGWIWTTGGSTSMSKRVAVSSEDFREEVRVFGHALTAAGLEAGDRVANLTWAGELSASFILTGAVLDTLPVLQLPILGHTPPARVVELCRELRATVLLVFPFVAFRLANFVLARGETLPLDKVLYAGERLHPDQRAALMQAFSPRILAQFGYGSVDCGPIAAVDRARGEDVLRPLEGYSRVELLDDHDRVITQPDALGRLAITNLGRTLSPVIRFPVGDLGRWVDAPEASGRGGAFRLERRAHLSVKLAFWVVAHADVVAEAQAVPELSSVVQLVVTRKDGVDWLTVRVAPARDGADAAAAAEALQRRLRAVFPALGEPPGSELSPVLVVEVCAPAAMELTRAGKVEPIVEGRER